jgi:hypothetical protein
MRKCEKLSLVDESTWKEAAAARRAAKGMHPSHLVDRENEFKKYGIMELPKSDAILLSKKI